MRTSDAASLYQSHRLVFFLSAKANASDNLRRTLCLTQKEYKMWLT
jgi:hypothetical protein